MILQKFKFRSKCVCVAGKVDELYTGVIGEKGHKTPAECYLHTTYYQEYSTIILIVDRHDTR